MYSIHHISAEQWLKTLPTNSRDGGISDFPYGLSFMGRKWDYDLPSVEALTEYYRVLKPGAFLLGFSSSRTYHRLACRLEDVGFEIRDCIMWLYGSGFPKSLNISKAFTKISKEDIAALWKGWGSCLKPAYEPIVVAMKPLEGTFVQNAEKYGVAGLNIDECRIEYKDEKDYKQATSERVNAANHNIDRTKYNKVSDAIQFKKNRGSKNGRYPANLLVSDDNIGGASRFYYCAKACPSDRNYGLKGRKNIHPTVKPLKLTRYLARLIKTPFADAQYINPYSGSGTEMMGFILEGMNVEGCEMELNSFNDSSERCAFAFEEANKIMVEQELFKEAV